MAERLRNVHQDPPRFPVVTEKGLIKLIAVEDNIGSAVALFEGEPMIQPAWLKRGWRLLHDLYKDERREDHWKVYVEYLDAKKRGMETDEFPAEFLPAEVRHRLAGHTPGKKRWTPPNKVEAAEVDGDDDGKHKPTRRAHKKADET